MKTEITPPAASVSFEAKAGKCETRCTNLPIFLGIFFAAIVFTFMAGTPITVSILRYALYFENCHLQGNMLNEGKKDSDSFEVYIDHWFQHQFSPFTRSLV